jgi:hypothetical protein
MAVARPPHDQCVAGDPDVERLALELGRILLAAARDHPEAWRAALAGEDAEGQRRTPAKRGRPAEAKPEGA